MTIEFRCSKLSSEANPPRSLPDLLIRTSADFEINIDGETLYDEPDFPVIELAASLANWAGRDAINRPDFDFDSMSTPDTGWVWLRRAAGGWRVGSIHQRHASLTVWSESEIQHAVSEFSSRIVRCVATCLKTDVLRWIPELGAR